MNNALKDNLTELLSELDLGTLNSLLTTSTQQLVKEPCQDKDVAIKNIIRCSPDAETILKRRLITRDVLFQYLNKHNVSLYPPITKDYLIDTVLAFWVNNTSSIHNTVSLQQIENVSTENQDVHVTASSQTNVNEMAIKFSEWFYEMFNKCSPIGVEHFWPDCRLKLNIIAGEHSTSEEVTNNAPEAVQLLFTTKSTHRIMLNPNLMTEGVQGRMDVHGLIVVLACGTIHVDSLCAGVFEQVFGLARDPLNDNNWKVKHTELNLRSSTSINNAPRLSDNPLTANLLITDSANLAIS